MSIKNILLAYNGSESSDAALRMAIMMHKKHDAHITGLFAYGQSHVQQNLYPWMPDSVRTSLASVENEAYAAVKARFYDKVGEDITADKLHWQVSQGTADLAVAEQASLYDITVVGRYDALMGAAHLTLHPEQITYRSGRPILMVPKDWQPRPFNEHAIIAWDNRHTSSRALTDAMQILETKKLITVLRVDDGRNKEPKPGITVETALERHNIDVESVTIKAPRRKIGKEIVKFSNNSGADILVLGAFEHSLFREELLGGLTSALIRETTMPLLMSC